MNSFSPLARKKYEETKAEILKMESEYRQKYGDDWRNIAVFNAYRMVKESDESGEFPLSEEVTQPVEVRIGDGFYSWDSESKQFVFSRPAEVAKETNEQIEESKIEIKSSTKSFKEWKSDK